MKYSIENTESSNFTNGLSSTFVEFNSELESTWEPCVLLGLADLGFLNVNVVCSYTELLCLTARSVGLQPAENP